MRLMELCSYEDKVQLYQMLVGKTRDVLGLGQSDMANIARIDSIQRPKPQHSGIVRAKGLIPHKKWRKKKITKKFTPKPMDAQPKIPGLALATPSPGQRVPIASNQPERGAYALKNVAGHQRRLYEPSTLSKYPGRPTDNFNSLSP